MSVWTACWQGLGLVVGALLAVLSWLWITRPRTNAPGPTPLPLLGNLPHFWRKLPVVVNDFRKLQRCYGDVFRFYLGPKLILVATQPNDARRLLVGCKVRERDDFATRALFAYTGNGLIVSKGELWKAHRKIIEPTFHSEVLNGYMEAFNEGARFLCSQLEEAKGVAIDISKMLHHTSFHVLALSLFGISVDELEPDRRKQAEFVTVSLAALELIQVRTFVLAASDSTATALSSIFALLGLHPEWQDAIQKEVDEIFGTGDHYLRPAIDSDLAQLKVTEAVIKESLRLFPAVPVAPVFASEDIPLSDGRYVAPRGSVVFVFLNLLHRQPALFPDPDKFEPRRFLEGGVAGALFPYSFLPFGAGSRLCVGARFAMLVMKTTLAMVMRQFRIVASCTREELEEIAVFITGKPVRGIRIQCIPRSAPTMKN
ncbi:cytochrome P450 4d2-like isoform X3 [Schistocerca piceifrons]|uniref:cytochrome P450 4d2-like isoform X3 n=1 Tax=Schistocerca piceifrons TaxID=274613 RepID=UPI001F5F6A5C|nr:cytochrome P450 4d2-like isoform X3 [Schistocerca piceifrons]